MRKILLVTIALGMIGCVGGLESAEPDPEPDPDPDPVTNEGRVLYDTNVHTIMAAKCAGCHTAGQPAGNVTGFVESDRTKAYETMVNYVAVVGSFASSTAPVLTKVVNGHQGIVYTPTELGSITTWLDKELEIRNPGVIPEDPNMPGPETASQMTKRLIKEWSGCMTKADFETANMAQGVGGWQTNNNQECDNCHATAGEGFIASRDATFFFDNLAKHSALIQQYYLVDYSEGLATAKVVVNRTAITNVATRQPGHTEHPSFNADDGTQGINAIVEFHTLTAAHAATPATCEVPAGRLVD
ncbi:MAG: hypothetical protein H0T79_18775 [Deltaproteobacteria bacterium]|nr:hypothetical protein [Deltaproteobacteria bacterium]